MGSPIKSANDVLGKVGNWGKRMFGVLWRGILPAIAVAGMLFFSVIGLFAVSDFGFDYWLDIGNDEDVV
ncbi:MAG: hypothetical protein AAF869_02555, partial [Pseudomonadota bacterium]